MQNLYNAISVNSMALYNSCNFKGIKTCKETEVAASYTGWLEGRDLILDEQRKYDDDSDNELT